MTLISPIGYKSSQYISRGLRQEKGTETISVLLSQLCDRRPLEADVPPQQLPDRGRVSMYTLPLSFFFLPRLPLLPQETFQPVRT